MVFCIVFSGNNYLNEKHDQNIAANGSNCIDMARAGHATNPTINLNQLNAGVRHGATASVPSPSMPATPSMTATTSNANVSATANPIPTTIDGLIEFIAKNGDEFEEKILNEITQMNEPTLFR